MAYLILILILILFDLCFFFFFVLDSSVFLEGCGWQKCAGDPAGLDARGGRSSAGQIGPGRHPGRPRGASGPSGAPSYGIWTPYSLRYWHVLACI